VDAKLTSWRMRAAAVFLPIQSGDPQDLDAVPDLATGTQSGTPARLGIVRVGGHDVGFPATLSQ
jgi:hypothetical protein